MEPIRAAAELEIGSGLGCGYILWQHKGHTGTLLAIEIAAATDIKDPS